MALLLDRIASDSATLGGGSGSNGVGKLPKGVPPLFSLQSPLKSSKEVRHAYAYMISAHRQFWSPRR